MSQEVLNESGCRDPPADHSPKIARTRKRSDPRHAGRQLAHPLRLRLCAEYDIPNSRRDPENRIRLTHMMRQMPRAQTRFNRARGLREMNSIMHVLIHGESANDSAIEDHARRQTEPRERAGQ